MSNTAEDVPVAVPLDSLPAGTKFTPIPQPPEHLFGVLGNLPDIEPGSMIVSFWHLKDLYGDIFTLNTLSAKLVVVSNLEYARQIQDDEKFEKGIVGPLKVLRNLMGDGLFTAYPSEPNWHKGHRLLVPIFGPLGIKKMFPEMLDIASQMILKWDRAGDERIDTADQFTRLTFDTIGLCAFNFRFNQFYKENQHPFAKQMSDTLLESTKQANRSRIENSLRIWSAGKMTEDITAMKSMVDELIAERKKNPRPDVKDMLNVMLEATDPVSGEKMDEENIRHNMITFLIAGHETTSGTLSFLFYELLKNPEKLFKAQQEVDEVLGNDAITIKHLPELKYIAASIKESLRLHSPIGGLWRTPKKDMVLSGKYRVDAGSGVFISLGGLHTDPKVWGDDAKEFKPERMLNDDHPEASWRPFGVGMRSCIGRFFAEQEMILNVALILQRFQVEMADPQYELIVSQKGTLKPLGFAIKLRRRPGKSLMVGLSSTGQAVEQAHHQHQDTNNNVGGQKSKMVIAYGSNAGSCKILAEDLQSTAPEHGFDAEVLSLDAITENIPASTPTIIVASSYEGKPTDNAKKFVAWLKLNADKKDFLKHAQFALFGVGNTEWVSTYQKVPKTIEALMKEQGAHQICETFFSDVKVDTNGDWEKWTESLWRSLKDSGKGGESEHKFELKASVTRHNAPAAITGDEEGYSWGIVKSARSLGGQEVGPEKREIEIQLPAESRYRTGDYLSVLPCNHPDVVKRVLARFDLHADDLISVSGTRKAFLKTAQPVGAGVLFSQRVELNGPATQRQLQTVLEHTRDEGERASLESLANASDDGATFQAQVVARNYSVLDVLEDHPSADLPLAAYLDMLRPLAPRLYSVASSPLAQHPERDTGYTASLIYDVHSSAARSGRGRAFHGVASSYLAGLRPGMRLRCAVRPTNSNFHLPPDPATPVVMIAAGTGIAPMRGFLQERAAIAAARGGSGGGEVTENKDGAAAAAAAVLGPAILYFGCRDYASDNLHAAELDAWQEAGVVQVRRAFSRRGPPPSPGSSSTGSHSDGGCFKYVHERLWADKDEINALFEKGAKFFLCGSAGKLARSTADTLKRIWLEQNAGKSDEEAEAWLQGIKETRYVTDVFD